MTAIKKNNGIRKKIGGDRQAWLLTFAVVAIVVIMSILTDKFMQVSNVMNIFVQIATLGICALGSAVVMISGGFDLTIGNVIALAGCSSAVVMASGHNAAVGVIVGIVVGIVCGFLNGLMVVICKAEPFIVTLALMTIYNGITLLITGGKNVAVQAEGFTFGRDRIGGVFPITIIFLLIIFILIHLLLQYTKFGRRIYAIGDNEEAAYLSGIKVKRNKIYIYTLNGVLVGIAAVFLLSRLRSGNASMGDQFLMQSIAAAVIGGVSMSGGKGTVIGVFLGTLLIGIVNNSLNILQVPSFWQYVVLGVIILLAVFVSNLGKDNR